MNFSYIFTESLNGLKRNRSATMITVFAVGTALLLLGFFMLITLNFSLLAGSLRSRVEIEVFLKEEESAGRHEAIGTAIKRLRGVSDAGYISKEEAARIFQKEIGEDFSGILEANPLPASYRLSLAEGWNNPDSVQVIVTAAKKIDGVESVIYRKEFLTIVDRRAKAFNLASIFIGLVLALSAVTLVANTIRLAIHARRETIRTMKLVGAGSWFIRMPFLLEGSVQGMIGGILAAALIFVTFTFFLLPISEDLMITIDISAGFYFMLIGIGALLGLIGSMVSIGRFLKEALVER